MVYDVFISYSSKDSQKVNAYADMLRSNGYSVWVDQTDISHGHEFPEEITKAIQECGLLVFFSSKHSNASKWVKREIVYADKQDKTILPICLDDTEYNSSLQLLLSGVEHIDAATRSEDAVFSDVLSAIGKEIGLKNDLNCCPIIKKDCPVGNYKTVDFSVQERISTANQRMALKYRIRCEAFVFTALCEMLWVLIIGSILLATGTLNHTFSLLICTTISYFLCIYATHLSTNSLLVPGWYNRHLTSYGALILGMNFFITTLCMGISAIFCIGIVNALPIIISSLVGCLGIACIYRQKKVGYYLLWIDTFLFSASCIPLWSPDMKILGTCIVLLVVCFFMSVLTYTLKLRFNGSSTWGVLFGKDSNHNDQEPSKIENFLMKIWTKLYI